LGVGGLGVGVGAPPPKPQSPIPNPQKICNILIYYYKIRQKVRNKID